MIYSIPAVVNKRPNDLKFCAVYTRQSLQNNNPTSLRNLYLHQYICLKIVINLEKGRGGDDYIKHSPLNKSGGGYPPGIYALGILLRVNNAT